MRPPKVKATATHHGMMVEVETAGVDTMTTIHAMAGKAKAGTTGHARQGRRAARARLGTSLLIASCGKTVR